MPRADYVPYSTVKPEELRRADEKVQIGFPGVEFHNSIGQAVAGVGRGMETVSHATKLVADSFDNLGANFSKVGETLWNRAIGLQDVQNQTTQTKAEIEYDKYVGEKQIAFNKLQGDAANEGALKAHLKDIEDARTKMLKNLPNEAVKKGFERSTASSIGRVGMQAAEHAAKETRRSYIESSEARVDQLQDQISKETGIKETADKAKKVHDEIFGKQAPAKGWTLDVANNNFRKVLGDAYASQIATIARDDPTLALKMLRTEENKALIPQPKYDGLMEHILGMERVQVSRNIGNKIQDENPDGTLEEKKAKAKEMADKYPHQPLLADDAVRVVEQRHEAHRREIRQQEERDKETVEQELYGFGNKEGKIPTKVEDLWANPETRKAWERLSPKDKNRVAQILARSAKGDYPDTPMARTRMWELQGMHVNDPARFRDLDLLQEEIPWTMRTQLRDLQLKVIKEGIKLENDPKTTAAIAKMRDILPKDITPAHKDKWNTFTGLVREGLKAEYERRGYDKPLSEEEIRTLGKTLLEKMPGTAGWWFGSDKPLWQTLKEIPEATLDGMRERWPNESVEQLAQRYRRTIIADEYQKYTTTKTQPKPPVVTAKPPPEPPKPPPEEQQGPQKPAEKRGEYLARKAAEFRSRLIGADRRAREEEAKNK